jgi:hypothetical protein
VTLFICGVALLVPDNTILYQSVCVGVKFGSKEDNDIFVVQFNDETGISVISLRSIKALTQDSFQKAFPKSVSTLKTLSQG